MEFFLLWYVELSLQLLYENILEWVSVQFVHNFLLSTKHKSYSQFIVVQVAFILKNGVVLKQFIWGGKPISGYQEFMQ